MNLFDWTMLTLALLLSIADYILLYTLNERVILKWVETALIVLTIFCAGFSFLFGTPHALISVICVMVLMNSFSIRIGGR